MSNKRIKPNDGPDKAYTMPLPHCITHTQTCYAISVIDGGREIPCWIWIRLPIDYAPSQSLADKLVRSFHNEAISPERARDTLQRLLPYAVRVEWGDEGKGVAA